MRMFGGIAAALTLASGVAMAAATATQNQEPRIWVSKDGDAVTKAVVDVVELDDQDGPFGGSSRCSPGAARSSECRSAI